MLQSIDHVVVVVRELARASADYEQAGFAVTPGGEHAGGATHNALVAFADGTYIELIAFKAPDQPQEHRWWERLQRGEGLVDYALLSDDLDRDAERARQRGLAVRGPVDGGRRRPDGQEIAWRSFFLGTGAGRTALPFVIQDVTARELRVPGGSATRHRLPTTGVAGLVLVVARLDQAASELAALLGDAGEPGEANGERARRRFRLGLDRVVGRPRQWLELVEPASAASPAGQRLAALGEGPFELVLAGAGEATTGELLAGPLHGAHLRLGA